MLYTSGETGHPKAFAVRSSASEPEDAAHLTAGLAVLFDYPA